MTRKAEASTLPQTADELHTLRRQLALDADEDVPGAAERLEEVELALHQLERGQERRDLAEQERRARSEAAQRADEARERRDREARHAELVEKRQQALLAVQTAIDGLAVLITDAIVIDDDLRNVRDDLGWLNPRASKYQIQDFLFWRLGRLGAGLADCETPPAQQRIPLIPEGDK
jgi:hypothetical protein